MKMEDRQASRIHYNMALIGGFLGAYGVVSRGNFPSAQTGNMISILTMAIGRKPLDFLIHVGALVVYVAAIVLCTWLPKHAKIRLPQLSLAVSSIAAVLMTMIPMNADPILSLYPLFLPPPSSGAASREPEVLPAPPSSPPITCASFPPQRWRYG